MALIILMMVPEVLSPHQVLLHISLSQETSVYGTENYFYTIGCLEIWPHFLFLLYEDAKQIL